jgi:hypothetical protein
MNIRSDEEGGVHGFLLSVLSVCNLFPCWPFASLSQVINGESPLLHVRAVISSMYNFGCNRVKSFALWALRGDSSLSGKSRSVQQVFSDDNLPIIVFPSCRLDYIRLIHLVRYVPQSYIMFRVIAQSLWFFRGTTRHEPLGCPVEWIE